MIYSPRVCKAMKLAFYAYEWHSNSKEVEPESRLHFH